MNKPISFEEFLLSKGIVNEAKLTDRERAAWYGAYEDHIKTIKAVPPKGIQATALPTQLMICGASTDFQFIEAEAEAGKPKLKKFSIVGYTGGMMRPAGWPYPVVVDLEGLSIPRQNIPALSAHEHGVIAGHTETIEKSQQRLKLTGVFSGYHDTEQTPSANAAREIVRLAANGFDWQASIGASPDKYHFVSEGESYKANGRNFTGPLYAIEKSTLAEISFVAIGADMNTSAKVAATAAINQGASMNEFEKWLKANGFVIENLAPEVKASLEKIHAKETATESRFASLETKLSELTASTAKSTSKSESPFDATIKAIEAETERRNFIDEQTAIVAQTYIGDMEKIQELKELCAAAKEDKSTDKRSYELALLRFGRGRAPSVLTATDKGITNEIIEAAICATYKLPNFEQKFSDQTLQAAHKHFKRGIGLKEMLRVAAKRNNNWSGSDRDEQALCLNAFRRDPYSLQAAGPSSIAVPGILSNVANKFMAAGFGYGEQSWRKISKIKPANDFKQMSTYRLTGNNKFVKVSPGGEIKHGTLSELTYTNQVDTYGRMLGLDRRDIRNDDLGTFTGGGDELGRGAIDSLNEVFWTEWLDDSTFFPTDKSYNNYDDGATDSVLSLAGLDNANTIFSLQTKPDGTPLGIMPKLLLVPMALWATAKNLMGGMFTASAQSTATVTTENIWRGMFDVIPSVYLQSSAITGYSATAWYLLADPMNVAAIEVAFLDGVETPTVETSEFDFDMLGLSMRAYLDWGCNKQEYRAGVKLKGAA